MTIDHPTKGGGVSGLYGKFLWFVLCLPLVVAGAARSEPLRIASLNPIVSDLARQVGGADVEVIDLMPLGANPHSFYPSPSDLKLASGSALVLAAGKGLESYLGEFRESLGGNVPVFEVGDAVPSLMIELDAVFICCPAHARKVVDPHWWHSVKNAARAVRAIEAHLSAIDPDRAALYAGRAKAYGAELDALYAWARKRVQEVPRRDRELATSHAAFSYLCREFGLRSITVQGLSTEQNPEPGYLKDVVEVLRDHDVRAVFPEDNANPKVMASMVRETGVAVGGELFAAALPKDDPTYAGMMRHNITTIVDSLLGKR